MFHPLALIKIEDGGAEHFLEALFQIAFIDRHFAAELFDSERFADVLKEHFPGADDLFPVRFICQELTLETFHFFLTYHAFQAIEQQHLALRVDEDILHAVRIAMVQEGLQYEAGPSAERQYFGERGRMTKVQHVLAKCAFGFTRPSELGEMDGKEAEAQDIHGINPFGAAWCFVDPTGVAFDAIFPAIHVAGYAKSQFQVILGGVVLFTVIDEHAQIVEIPLGVLVVPFDGVLDRTWYMSLFFIQ